ncbi:MAG TPA: protein-tyrosine-phosphatase [Pirellulaceae bacterium]
MRHCRLLTRRGLLSALAFWVGIGLITPEVKSEIPELYPPLRQYLRARIAEGNEIPEERKRLLEQVSQYVRGCSDTDTPSRIVFICTHNSRRSQMAQLWAALAARYYERPDVLTYSGGTETTAFHPHAVEALVRAGWKIMPRSRDDNAIQVATWGPRSEPIECFSKTYDDEPNPRRGFLAVMTCSDADRTCPRIPGASMRFALPYIDPKISDGTPRQTPTYDARCAQIAREMLYAFREQSATLRHPEQD